MSGQNPKRTYLDTCILIAAVRADDPAHRAALAILDDPDRQYVTSDFVRLELVPKALREGRKKELEFYRAFFERARRPAPEQYGDIVSRSIDISRNTGLKALDALHVSSAVVLGAQEIVTADAAWRRVSSVPVKVLSSERGGGSG